MWIPLLGIHHVSAIATDPQRTLDFYVDVLGLRLVKRTVNFDDPGTYHLYFGNESGEPGTILTFFPWPLARQGSRGVGQVTVVSFSVPEGSLGFWQQRLTANGLTVEDTGARLEEEVLTLLDPDGLKLELVAHAGAEERQPWEGGGIPAEHAIRGFYSVTLSEQGYAATSTLLTEVMDFRLVAECENRFRFDAGDGGAGARVEVICVPAAPYGRIAAGSVHHVAFRVADEEAQVDWRRRLIEAGRDVSPVLDRQYFKSIYFREPGGVLFEIATDQPGFTRDESLAALGSELKLPPWLESRRQRIEDTLPPLATGRSAPATGPAASAPSD